MNVLVTASSKHGATGEIADRICERLRARGLTVTEIAPDEVKSLEGYDAVIVGSAVYFRQWTDTARAFVARFHNDLKKLPSWGFSVGLSGVPKRAPQDPKKIGPVDVSAVFHEHKTFAGRYDPSDMSVRERTVARLSGAVEGDYRDWERIDTWADEIADSLNK